MKSVVFFLTQVVIIDYTGNGMITARENRINYVIITLWFHFFYVKILHKFALTF